MEYYSNRFPTQIDGMPCTYSYEEVHVCIIREKAPDLNLIRQCAGENPDVTVELEPTNQYDNEAVALYTANGIHMGYLYKNRLKDMAYDYLKKGYPIKAKICSIEENDIYINIAFYAPSGTKRCSGEITFTLLSRSNEMQENLELLDEGDEVEFDYDWEKEKYVFVDDCGNIIGYAPSKYDDVLGGIDDDYDAVIDEWTELDNGRISVEITIRF